MIVNVHMKDGRTTFQFAARRDLRRVLGTDPGEERRPAIAWVFSKELDTAWRRIRIQHISKNSVSHVLAAEDIASSDEDLPAKAEAEERQKRYEEREPAGAPA